MSISVAAASSPLTDAPRRAAMFAASPEPRADTDVAVLVFELNALVISANTGFVLHEDPVVLARARTAVERALAAATPA